MGTYAVQNFGCRASAADGDAIGEALERDGGLARESWQRAAVVVVNTCAVTAAAERDARAAIRRIGRSNPQARIVVTGCYAQRAPEELRALPGVTEVVGNSRKSLVPAAALRSFAEGPPLAAGGFLLLASLLEPAGQSAMLPGGEHWDASALPLATGGGTRTRPVLKVQDGCGNRCSFCVIPETRGPSRSVALGEALAAARAFAARGGQELVLSGINLGRWGAELAPRRTLAELVRALLEETALPRLRLSSIEPMDWSAELIALVARYARGAHPRLAPHAHLPLQSGADSVLRAMHRRYRPWHYAEKLWALREAAPDAALGADVMVGFPGETDALFAESLRFIEALPLTYLHLFPFSPRPRTPAEALHRAAPVAAATARSWMEALRSVERGKWRAFASRFVGAPLSAVTLLGGRAITANFLPVTLPEGGANRLATVRIASIQTGDVLQAVEWPTPPCDSADRVTTYCCAQ